MSGTERTKEVVEKDLQETRDALEALIKKINDQWYQEGGDEEKIKELEKTEEDLKRELEGLMGWVSSSSKEKKGWKEKLGEMSYEEALSYLWEIKDYTWSQLLKEDRKWIMAVQVVLKNKWYDEVWKIDWYYGKRTKAWVKKFQEDAGFTWKDLDWLPWSKTINAILWNWTGKKTGEAWGEDVRETWEEKTVKDEEWNTFVWTVDKDGNPLTGTYKMKDGTEYKVKDGNIE